MTDEEEVYCERLEEALRRIVAWGNAYPTDIFPEPDETYFKTAHRVLTAHAMSLDRLSAAAMRHVVLGVARIAREALKDGDEP